jgi:hypothetical protein
MFGKVVGELLEAGANEAEVDAACSYVLGAFDSPSVFAVVKWFSVAQTGGSKLSDQDKALDELRRRT